MAHDKQDIIELHGDCTGSCLRVAITLEELQLPYRVIGASQRDNGRHPHQPVPTVDLPCIVDRAARPTPFVLSQCHAIIFYLVEQSPGHLLPTDRGAQRGLAFERFFFFLSDVISPSESASLLRRAHETDGAHMLDMRAMTMLGRAERFLEDGLFMAGPEYSIADIAAVTMSLAYEKAVNWDSLPRLRRWYEDVRRRPAVAKGLHAFDGLSY